ncbi:hypothetical protein BDN72DRAFT_203957 [Pluteus cervinus]|uniref:Uncharacterized protein n=1 Tax=Pluteus cervinus TaxID=181527 RepID=A0ACD3AIE4_9AGAR|nr:hypothetical protein BDN72DRAFT_203957 [Pluteus cervinus]
MTDIDAKRAKLDEEILAVQLHLSDLRSQRNVLAPISSLPADVLVHIFRSTNDGPISTSNSYNAFLVSWICRLWRKIATRNQSLWSYIDCKDIQLVQLCLERAPTLQLDLQFLHFYAARSSTEFYHIVLSELERTSSLSLKSGSANQPPYLEDFVSRPAPVLRSLSLDGFLLPDGTRMFTGISPPLHSLSLFNCDFLWDAPIFGTRLTSLHITSPKSIMSLGGFLSMLRSIPRLQTLRLWNAFRSSSSLLPPFQQTAVHLPHLTLLAVSNCSTDICCSILLGITFTNTANVTLNLHDEPATSRLHNVLQALEQCTVESPWVIDTISAVHGTYCEVRLLSERHGDWTTTKEAVVCVSISPCTMDAAEILHAFLALNRDNLETVILNTSTLDITIRPAIWQQVLGTLPRLTKLKVRHRYNHLLYRSTSFNLRSGSRKYHIQGIESTGNIPLLRTQGFGDLCSLPIGDDFAERVQRGDNGVSVCFLSLPQVQYSSLERGDSSCICMP